MKVSEMYPSNYLKAADLQGRNVTVTIKGIVFETLGDDRRPIVYFRDKDKGLVLNKTNANNIVHAYGDDTDDWVGSDIILYPTMVDFQGRSVEAIRVKIPPRRPPARVTSGPQAQSAPPDDNEPPPYDEVPF